MRPARGSSPPAAASAAPHLFSAGAGASGDAPSLPLPRQGRLGTLAPARAPSRPFLRLRAWKTRASWRHALTVSSFAGSSGSGSRSASAAPGARPRLPPGARAAARGPQPGRLGRRMRRARAPRARTLTHTHAQPARTLAAHAHAAAPAPSRTHAAGRGDEKMKFISDGKDF